MAAVSGTLQVLEPQKERKMISMAKIEEDFEEDESEKKESE